MRKLQKKRGYLNIQRVLLCSFCFFLLISGIWYFFLAFLKGSFIRDASIHGRKNVVNFYLSLKPSFLRMKFSTEDTFTDLPSEFGKGSTLLHFASKHQQLEIIDLLCSKGSDVNAKDELNRTPLFYAASGRGNIQTVQTLLNFGANVNSADTYGSTALHRVVRYPENLSMLELLIDSGATVNAIDSSGKTPLDYAKDESIIQILRKYGAKSGKDFSVAGIQE